MDIIENPIVGNSIEYITNNIKEFQSKFKRMNKNENNKMQ